MTKTKYSCLSSEERLVVYTRFYLHIDICMPRTLKYLLFLPKVSKVNKGQSSILRWNLLRWNLLLHIKGNKGPFYFKPSFQQCSPEYGGIARSMRTWGHGAGVNVTPTAEILFLTEKNEQTWLWRLLNRGREWVERPGGRSLDATPNLVQLITGVISRSQLDLEDLRPQHTWAERARLPPGGPWSLLGQTRPWTPSSSPGPSRSRGPHQAGMGLTPMKVESLWETQTRCQKDRLNRLCHFYSLPRRGGAGLRASARLDHFTQVVHSSLRSGCGWAFGSAKQGSWGQDQAKGTR